jgi:hypothetical protein
VHQKEVSLKVWSNLIELTLPKIAHTEIKGKDYGVSKNRKNED